MILPIDDPKTIPTAVDVIARGNLIVIPTDTVYGVACSPYKAESIDRLYEAKNRPRTKAMQILLADVEDATQVGTGFPAAAQKLADAFWPGALTITLPKRDGLPENLSIYPTVGVRLPDHAALRAIIRALGGTLGATSANLSGEASPTNVDMAIAALGDAVALYIDGGETPGAVSSTVVETTLGDDVKLLREGPIAEADIRRALA